MYGILNINNPGSNVIRQTGSTSENVQSGQLYQAATALRDMRKASTMFPKIGEPSPSTPESMLSNSSSTFQLIPKDRLTQYGSRCEWLKDEKFLRDLEGDSVDTEILDEELRSLQDDEPETCRGKTAKFLEGNAFQIALCVLVLVDAGVVIAEILLDLHAIRGQFQDTAQDLKRAVNFLRDTYADDLQHYHGDDMHYILEILSKKYPKSNIYNDSKDSANRTRRHINLDHFFTISSADSSEKDMHIAPNAESVKVAWHGHQRGSGTHYLHMQASQDVSHSSMQDSGTKPRLRHASSQTPVQRSADMQTAKKFPNDFYEVTRSKRAADSAHSNDGAFAAEINYEDFTESPISTYNTLKENNTEYSNKSENAGYYKYPKKKKTLADKLLKIAHILHYISIGILGLFVVQLVLKIYGMGWSFFKNKMELFDGVIIMASFAIDVVFVEGIGGAQGEEAAALLIVFLLWRILRIINGIMITAKKRQEFRIKLQKRARRRAEKKIEVLEDDRGFKEKEIQALKNLCYERGALEDEVASCRPKRRSVFAKMDTSSGLSSIASLSLGLSMSMTGAMKQRPPPGGGQVAPGGKTPPANSRRQSFQDLVPVGPHSGTQSPLARTRRPVALRRTSSPPTNPNQASIEMISEEEEADTCSSPVASSNGPVTSTSVDISNTEEYSKVRSDISIDEDFTEACCNADPAISPKQVTFDLGSSSDKSDETRVNIELSNGPINCRGTQSSDSSELNQDKIHVNTARAQIPQGHATLPKPTSKKGKARRTKSDQPSFTRSQEELPSSLTTSNNGELRVDRSQSAEYVIPNSISFDFSENEVTRL